MAEEIKEQNEEEVNLNRNFIYNFIEEDIAPGGQFEGKKAGLNPWAEAELTSDGRHGN